MLFNSCSCEYTLFFTCVVKEDLRCNYSYSLQIWKATVIQKLNGGREFVIENLGWDMDLNAGQDLTMNFVARMNGDQLPTGTMTIESPCGSGSYGSGSGSSHTQPPAHSHTNPPGGGHPITPGHSSGGGKLHTGHVH